MNTTRHVWLSKWRYFRLDRNYGIWSRVYANEQGDKFEVMFYPHSGSRYIARGDGWWNH